MTGLFLKNNENKNQLGHNLLYQSVDVVLLVCKQAIIKSMWYSYDRLIEISGKDILDSG
jgi:hypothetical protein